MLGAIGSRKEFKLIFASIKHNKPFFVCDRRVFFSREKLLTNDSKTVFRITATMMTNKLFQDEKQGYKQNVKNS